MTSSPELTRKARFPVLVKCTLPPDHFHFNFYCEILKMLFNYKSEYQVVQRLSDAIFAMVRWTWELAILIFLAVFPKLSPAGANPYHRSTAAPADGASYCLSWRMSVEANNVPGWRTVPSQCFRHLETYMIGGQYERDLDFIVNEISTYMKSIVISDDGMDGWILDVDDTCISNLFYYKGKRFGCDPYDPEAFRAWALKGACPAISAVLGLFNKLIEAGFKVFLITGRDELTMAQATIDNLHNQGFIGYERLILRRPEHKGQRAIQYKSGIRKGLVEEGYRIWGNVGDQWTDLQGDCKGNRTFKLPNPMYFVP